MRRPVLHVLRLLRMCAEGHFIYAAPTCEQQAEVDPDQMVAIVQQPLGGGGFVPTLHVKLAEDADPIATIKGRLLLRRGQLLRPHVHVSRCRTATRRRTSGRS